MADPIQTERFRLRYEWAERRRVNRLIGLVNQVFVQFDPEHLWKMGCPDDEYRGEIRDIAKNIDRERGMWGKLPLKAEEVANIFAIVLHTSFDSWTKPIVVNDKDRQMAERLLQLESELNH